MVIHQPGCSQWQSWVGVEWEWGIQARGLEITEDWMDWRREEALGLSWDLQGSLGDTGMI